MVGRPEEDLLPPHPHLRLAVPLVLLVGAAVAPGGPSRSWGDLSTVAPRGHGRATISHRFGIAVGASALAVVASAAHGVQAAVALVVP